MMYAWLLHYGVYIYGKACQGGWMLVWSESESRPPDWFSGFHMFPLFKSTPFCFQRFGADSSLFCTTRKWCQKKEAGSLRRRGPWWDMVGLCRCSQMLINKISGAANLPRKNCDQRWIRVCGWKLLWNPLMSLIFSYLLLSTYTKWAVFKTLLVCDYRGLYYQIIPT